MKHGAPLGILADLLEEHFSHNYDIDSVWSRLLFLIRRSGPSERVAGIKHEL